jgi:FkbM family methyltransferase
MNVLLGGVRRLAKAPLLRRLTTVTPLVRLSLSLRASLVRERRRFAKNELRSGPVTATYHLRESGLAVTLRHHGGDVMALDRIFSQHEYELPSEVERALKSLTHPLRVIDLGANIGLFGVWLLGRFPDARILAYEADPGTAVVHRGTIHANRLGNSWRLVEAYAGTQAGTTHFVDGLFGLSHGTDSSKGIEVPTVDVLPELSSADLVKIDIEGAEWPIVADSRFRELSACAVALEYHTRGCPTANPREAAENALRESGYAVAHAEDRADVGAGVLWGWRSPS